MNPLVKILLLSLILHFPSKELFSQDLALEWALSGGTGTREEVRSMVTDKSGNTYIFGNFENTVDFDHGPGIKNLSSNGGVDLFICKLNHLGQLIWAVSIGGSKWDHSSKLKYSEKNKELYVLGSFDGIVDFDPGAGKANLNSNSGKAFLLSLNSNGSFNWVRQLTHCLGFLDFDFDRQNNMIFAGIFNNSCDCDPGPGTFIITPSGSTHNDNFILKLDPNGNFLWARRTGGIYGESIKKLVVDTTGNIVVAGLFIGTVDFDPGSGTAIHSVSTNSAYLQKLDAQGDFLWVKVIENTAFNDLATTANDDFYITGVYSGTVDFNPGSGTFLLTRPIGTSMFVLKLNPTGNFIWVKELFGSNSFNNGQPLVVSNEFSDIFVCAQYSGTFDLDPGPATFQVTSTSSTTDFFIEKLDSSGNFILGGSSGGWNREIPFDMALSKDGDILVAGRFQGTSDFDPSNSSFKLTANGTSDDYFVQKIKNGNCGNFSLAYDSISQFNCSSTGYVSLHGINGSPPYSYSWLTTPTKNDSDITINKSGIYSITVTDSVQCTYTTSLIFDGPKINSTSIFDLEANLITNGFRVGLNPQISLDAFNNSCLDTSGILELVIDSITKLKFSSIAPSSLSGDTIRWIFPKSNYDSAHFIPQLDFELDSNAAIGDTVCFQLSIYPKIGDSIPQNNVKSYCFPVTNSYDPNDKQAYPIGKCESHYIKKNTPIIYTIRMQNTGNDEAFDVTIRDSLSSILDLNSIRILGTSHDMIAEYRGLNVVDFVFKDINLPDSATNEKLSHGYVIFEISAISNVPEGTVVNNNSNIFFDNNPAITTNTVTHTLVAEVPNCDKNTFITENKRDRLKLYPNPSTSGYFTIDLNDQKNVEIRITDINGRLHYQTNSFNEKILTLNTGFAPGLYFVLLSGENGMQREKLVVQ